MNSKNFIAGDEVRLDTALMRKTYSGKRLLQLLSKKKINGHSKGEVASVLGHAVLVNFKKAKHHRVLVMEYLKHTRPVSRHPLTNIFL